MALRMMGCGNGRAKRAFSPNRPRTSRNAAGGLQEISSWIDENQLSANRNMIFHALPKFLHRRKCKRLQQKKPKKVMVIKANHRYRKKPVRRDPLKLDYARHQRKQIYLETYSWHAQRFHMINRFGFRLPKSSDDGTFEESYFADLSNCLLQDMSFYSVVQLRGTLGVIQAGFNRLTSTKCYPGIGSKAYVHGYREGEIHLFKDGQYPFGALERASFMWRREVIPQPGFMEPIRLLWLWLHPASAERTIAELVSVFNLKSCKQQRQVIPSSGTSLRFSTLTKAVERYRTYVNAKKNLELKIMRQELNRFRLTGYRCQNVLAASLRGYQPFVKCAHWLEETGMEQAAYVHQVDYVSAAIRHKDHRGLEPRLIMGFNVFDPRLQMPTEVSKACEIDHPQSSNFVNLPRPDCLPDTLLWDSDFRERLAATMISDKKYETMRQEHAVMRGHFSSFAKQLQPVPIMLIKRPGGWRGSFRFGSGFDVIVPAGYGKMFWQAFVMWGARVGGLREQYESALMAGAEIHMPDTVAAKHVAAIEASERRARYARQPKKKRCNYRKLAVVSPFKIPWAELVRDWCYPPPVGGSSYYVVRDHSVGFSLGVCASLGLPYPRGLDERGLIQVRVHLNSEGELKPNALICLPSLDDWDLLKPELYYSTHAPVHFEGIDPDCSEPADMEESCRRGKPKLSQLLVCEWRQKLRRLCMPLEQLETLDSVRRQCSREVCGYVSSAGYCYNELKYFGVGYVTTPGLGDLLADSIANGAKKMMPFCLVRDVDSYVYRVGRIEVIEYP